MRTLAAVAVCSALVGAVLAGWGADGGAAARRNPCPAGTQKFVRVCIEKASAPPTNFVQATTVCAGKNRRLPTTAELDAFRQQDGVTLPGMEWTGTIVGSTSAIMMNDAGSYSEAMTTLGTAGFRCVA